MHRREDFPKVFIIAEIHPQFHGDMAIAQTMMLQAKLGGADAVKVQLYDPMVFGDKTRDYVTISKAEFKEMKQYADDLGIHLFASIFTRDRIEWCEDVDMQYYKLASITVRDDPKLCEEIIALSKPTLISLGMWDWEKQGLPFKGDQLTYFYCVSKYPTKLLELQMPIFRPDQFLGYSDHTIGLAACLYAISRGATYIEKHFTLNKAAYFPTEMGHSGSMNLDDLRQLRAYADSLTILRGSTPTEQ